jgi:hypothetical protein|tara:strand:- start:293 stop:451 length:159 start_codon:yes stop_codon:yes gene_type:complete
MSHVEITPSNASLIETNPAKIAVIDTMYTEAFDLFSKGLTPQFEITRLKQNF